MNTSTRARKALFIAIFLVLATFSGGQIARAQTIDTPATQAQIQQLQTTLVSLLTQLITQLQQQIVDLLTQQNATAKKVDTIVQNTTPVSGSVASSTPVAPDPKFKLLGVDFPSKSYGHYSAWVYWNQLKANGEEMDQTLDQNIGKSSIAVCSSKQIDASKTEVFINGSLSPSTISNIGADTSLSNCSHRVVFDITPNVWSHGTFDPSASTTMSTTVQLKVYAMNGEVDSTYPWHCEAWKTIDNSSGKSRTYWQVDLAHQCHHFSWAY